jgi:hypothetical protein
MQVDDAGSLKSFVKEAFLKAKPNGPAKDSGLEASDWNESESPLRRFKLIHEALARQFCESERLVADFDFLGGKTISGTPWDEAGAMSPACDLSEEERPCLKPAKDCLKDLLKKKHPLAAAFLETEHPQSARLKERLAEIESLVEAKAPALAQAEQECSYGREKLAQAQRERASAPTPSVMAAAGAAVAAHATTAGMDAAVLFDGSRTGLTRGFDLVVADRVALKSGRPLEQAQARDIVERALRHVHETPEGQAILQDLQELRELYGRKYLREASAAAKAGIPGSVAPWGTEGYAPQVKIQVGDSTPGAGASAHPFVLFDERTKRPFLLVTLAPLPEIFGDPNPSRAMAQTLGHELRHLADQGLIRFAAASDLKWHLAEDRAYLDGYRIAARMQAAIGKDDKEAPSPAVSGSVQFFEGIARNPAAFRLQHCQDPGYLWNLTHSDLYGPASPEAALEARLARIYDFAHGLPARELRKWNGVLTMDDDCGLAGLLKAAGQGADRRERFSQAMKERCSYPKAWLGELKKTRTRLAAEERTDVEGGWKDRFRRQEEDFWKGLHDFSQ